MTNCCELHWLHYGGLDRRLPESERLNVTSCHTLEATSKDLLSRLFWMSELQLERMTSYYTGTVTRSNPASTWETKPLYCYHPSTLHGTQSITNRKWQSRKPGACANRPVDLNKHDQLISSLEHDKTICVTQIGNLGLFRKKKKFRNHFGNCKPTRAWAILLFGVESQWLCIPKQYLKLQRTIGIRWDSTLHTNTPTYESTLFM